MIRGTIYSVLQTAIPYRRITDDMPLLGGELDSMGLVTAVVDIEEQLQKKGLNIRIMSENAMSKTKSPFKDVGSLIEYVKEIAAPEIKKHVTSGCCLPGVFE